MHFLRFYHSSRGLGGGKTTFELAILLRADGISGCWLDCNAGTDDAFWYKRLLLTRSLTCECNPLSTIFRVEAETFQGGVEINTLFFRFSA